MLLSDKDILEFQEMWKEHHGQEITKKDAYNKAIKLIELVEIAYKPLTEEDLLMVEESRKEIKEKLGS